MAQVYDMSCYSWLIGMIETDVPVVLFDPGLNWTSGLSNVHWYTPHILGPGHHWWAEGC
jgi:hypothetical protein